MLNKMIVSCELDGVCDDLLLGSMKKRRSTVFTWTIIFVMLYVYYVIYKKYKQNHRLSSDKKVYEKLISGKDDCFVFFHTLEVFMLYVITSPLCVEFMIHTHSL